MRTCGSGRTSGRRDLKNRRLFLFADNENSRFFYWLKWV